MSNQPPLNPDALEASAAAARIDWSGHTDWNGAPNSVQIAYRKVARAAVSAYLAVAQPVVNSVEELDKLPVGAVILDGDPCVLQMVEKSSIVGSEWAIANEEHIYTTGKITLPARVLYRPEVPGA